MPIDFIPIGTKLKSTRDDPTPLEDRKNHIACLHRGSSNDLAAAISGITIEDFGTKIQKLRLGAHRWGVAHMEAYLVQQLNAQFPDLRVSGHPISSANDFNLWIQKGKWDREKQVVIAFATVGAWGDNNQWAINAEAEFCAMLDITFSDYKSNGTLMMKPPQGKCFAAIFVKAKGSACTRFRNTCRRVWKIAVYVRTEGDKDEDDQTVMTVPVAGTVSNKKGKRSIPKLIAQETACMEKDGFVGHLGYMEGHTYLKSLLARRQKEKEAPASIALAKKDNDTDASTVTSPLTISLSAGSRTKPKGDIEKYLESQGIVSVDDIKKLIGVGKLPVVDTPMKEVPASITAAPKKKVSPAPAPKPPKTTAGNKTVAATTNATPKARKTSPPSRVLKTSKRGANKDVVSVSSD